MRKTPSFGLGFLLLAVFEALVQKVFLGINAIHEFLHDLGFFGVFSNELTCPVFFGPIPYFTVWVTLRAV
jgi:hypothetical protein